MDNLNFFIVSNEYVEYLQKAELKERGFSRVPNMDYGNSAKQKFLCGIVLKIAGIDYYVPVSSYKLQKPDNFLIVAKNGKITSSLRFNYMFPVPKELVTVRSIKDEPDRAYRSLLSQELRYCIANQDEIRGLANRTYKRVLLGKDKGLVVNSCAFKFLEEKCLEYADLDRNIANNKEMKPMRIKDRLTAAKAEADRINSELGTVKTIPDRDRGR